MSTDPADKPLCFADEALARRQAGNFRFISGRARFPTVQKEVLEPSMKSMQAAFASWIDLLHSDPPCPRAPNQIRRGVTEYIGSD